MSELYDTGYADRPDRLEIPFATNPALKVSGPGIFHWGMRRRVSQKSDGTYDGMLDALIKVWLQLPETDWNVLIKDPKTGSTVKMPRSEEVVDGFAQPALKPEDVVHIALKLGQTFYPEVFAAGLFEVAEGNSAPPQLAEDSSENDKTPTKRRKSAATS